MIYIKSALLGLALAIGSIYGVLMLAALIWNTGAHFGIRETNGFLFYSVYVLIPGAFIFVVGSYWAYNRLSKS